MNLEHLITQPAYQLTQTLLCKHEHGYRMVGERGAIIDTKTWHSMQVLYRDGKLHLNDETKTAAQTVATFSDLYRRVK